MSTARTRLGTDTGSDTGTGTHADTGPCADAAAGVRPPACGEDERSVLGAVQVLGEALTALDATDPDSDSIAFDRATDAVIAAARAVVKAAEPVLASPSRAVAAVRTALSRTALTRDALARTGDGCPLCGRYGPCACTRHW